MKHFKPMLLIGMLALLCSAFAGCGGASPADAYAEELNEPPPTSATHGSTLDELPPLKD